MSKRRRGAVGQLSHKPIVDAGTGAEFVDPFEQWERYPSDRAERNVRYQRIAWFVPGAGVSALSLFVLAAAGDGLKMLARGVIRMLMRRVAPRWCLAAAATPPGVRPLAR